MRLASVQSGRLFGLVGLLGFLVLAAAGVDFVRHVLEET